MSKWWTKKRIFLVGFLPALGFIVTLLLNVVAGPIYTTGLNQGALRVYSMGAILWSILSFFVGIYLYSKCSSMNHTKFFLGVSSVILGAAIPWLLAMLY
ncbi:hypothetical protein [Thalassotalea sediminis]|uniref:hypothetical protein n=1 Tax=Thalassotalea sediminis TaxID=1759089 RepID=UPI00257372CF|nr:hypothetical protein [Thalassotalea sediminis]